MKKVLILLTAILMISIPVAYSGCREETKAPYDVQWADFLQLDGIFYTNTSQTIPQQQDDLEFFDKIKTSLVEIGAPRDHEVQDGDASYLSAGTGIYSLKDYASSFRLVAETSEGLLLYESADNPSAQTGAEVFDIGGKVTSIELIRDFDLETLDTINDPDTIESLTEMILAAPVDMQDSWNDGQITWQNRIYLRFHLTDGTTTTRNYRYDSGVLQGHIKLPVEFTELVKSRIPYSEDLEGSQWKLIELYGKEPVDGSYISLYIRDLLVQGYDGCFSYGSTYRSTEPGTLKIEKPIISTSGFVNDYTFAEGVAEQADRYLKKLNTVTGYELIEDRLVLLAAGNGPALTFERLPEYPMDPADLAGTDWQLLEMNGEQIERANPIELSFHENGQVTSSAESTSTVSFYVADGDDILFGHPPIYYTQEEPRPGEDESQSERYMYCFNMIINYRLEPDRLELYTRSGDVLVFVPRQDTGS